MKTVSSLCPLLILTLATFLLAGCGTTRLGELSAVTPLPPAFDAAQTPATEATTSAQPATSRPAEQTPAATPTPLNLNLAAGSALAVAHATDAAMRPTPRTPISFAESPVRLAFDEFYDGYSVRTGLILSDKLVALDGQEIVIQGYMAPPLKAELDWFVLTRIQLAYCPFCSTAADWPDDIALVYLADSTIRPTERPMRIFGTLEVGPSIDPETGMLSLVRIYADKLELL
jgi:hypothetical protein